MAVEGWGVAASRCANMSGRGSRTDMERVLALVRERPGYAGSLYAYMVAGGEVDQDGPVDQSAFSWFQKGASVQKRLADLEKQKKVFRAAAKVRTHASELGFYPAGYRMQDVGNVARSATDVAPEARASGARGLAALRKVVGGV